MKGTSWTLQLCSSLPEELHCGEEGNNSLEEAIEEIEKLDLGELGLHI